MQLPYRCPPSVFVDFPEIQNLGVALRHVCSSLNPRGTNRPEKNVRRLCTWLEAARSNQGFLDHSSHPAGASSVYHSRPSGSVAIVQTNGPHYNFVC